MSISRQVALAAAALAAAGFRAAAVVQERVTLVEGLGVVLECQRRLGRPASTFMPTERIRHVIIVEVQRQCGRQTRTTA